MRQVQKQIRSLSGLASTRPYFFSTNFSVQNVRNSNLKFQAEDWFIHLYPFYPQVFKKRDKNVYEISSYSNVLALIFVNKNADTNAWETRKSISLKFKQVGYLLNVQPNSGRTMTIQTAASRDNTDRQKILQLKDLPKEQRVYINLRTVDPSHQQSTSSLSRLQQQNSSSSSSLSNWQLQTTIPYRQYNIMYKILENSLLDLSGWKFMMEIQKKQQISKMDNKGLDQREVKQLLDN